MFDLATVTDQPAYSDGDPVTVTVSAADGRPITVTEAKWARHALDETGNPHGDPVRFEINGNRVSGPARSGHGYLYVAARDTDGRDASTYVLVTVLPAGTVLGRSPW